VGLRIQRFADVTGYHSTVENLVHSSYCYLKKDFYNDSETKGNDRIECFDLFSVKVRCSKTTMATFYVNTS
jgi:hypothetical protein